MPNIDYERHDSKIQPQNTRDPPNKSADACFSGRQTSYRGTSPSLGMLREHRTEIVPSEFGLDNNPLSPLNPNWDQLLASMDQIPDCSLPNQHGSDAQSLNLDVPVNKPPEASLVKAQAACQCQTHSTLCLQSACLALESVPICQCCGLCVDWTFSPGSDLPYP